MKSKDFSFGFTKNIGRFTVLGRHHGNVRSRLYKMHRVYLNIWRIKIYLGVTRAWKFLYREKGCSTNDSNVNLLKDKHKDLRLQYNI